MLPPPQVTQWSQLQFSCYICIKSKWNFHCWLFTSEGRYCWKDNHELLTLTVPLMSSSDTTRCLLSSLKVTCIYQQYIYIHQYISMNGSNVYYMHLILSYFNHMYRTCHSIKTYWLNKVYTAVAYKADLTLEPALQHRPKITSPNFIAGKVSFLPQMFPHDVIFAPLCF